jgi:hypothetical protein
MESKDEQEMSLISEEVPLLEVEILLLRFLIHSLSFYRPNDDSLFKTMLLLKLELL